MTEYSVIGKRLPRIDGLAKAMGSAKYAADMALPMMLYGKILRSPLPHARIINIDTTLAERLPGVRGVITGRDFGGFRRGMLPNTRDECALASDKVRYIGEGVAAVAAINQDIAEEALDLIKVDYEELPAVFHAIDAMKEGAPQIHDHVKNNMSWECHYHFGDVEKGFRESDYIREDKFSTGYNTHGFLEPHAILADYDPSGRITVWASKQCPYFLWRHLGLLFGLSLDKVRVIQPYIGAGFGGKNDSFDLDFCAVLLSKKTGRPVKIVLSQKELLTAGRRRHAMFMDMKTGVKRDGTLVALQCKAIADGGAYTCTAPITMYLAGVILSLPYRLPNLKFDGLRVYTNKPAAVALRGHGAPHTRFAADVQLDMIAEDLEIDPVEIRLKNALKSGDITPNGLRISTCGLAECIERATETANWNEKRQRAKGMSGKIARGIGIACHGFVTGERLHPHDSCAAIVKVNEDGTVNLLTGATDIGQGSDTVLSMIAAEELGVSLENIDFSRIDTAFTPIDIGSYSSRVTYMSGNAVKIAAADAKKQLKETAAKKLGAKVEDIEFKDGLVFVKNNPERSMTFRQLARIASNRPESKAIIGNGSYTFLTVGPFDYETGEGNASAEYSFGAEVSEVEVNIETGQVRYVQSTLAADCGMALNPMAVEGQLEGCIVQGQGQALHENFIIEQGKTINPSFADYKMPRSLDAPQIKGIPVETVTPGGPYGAKEAGEGVIISTPPAIVNAIHDAIGVWIKDLPVTPEKILKALREKKGGRQ
jgi:4-hydroxybenzoyl-CoA reductase subunit alpha